MNISALDHALLMAMLAEFQDDIDERVDLAEKLAINGPRDYAELYSDKLAMERVRALIAAKRPANVLNPTGMV